MKPWKVFIIAVTMSTVSFATNRDDLLRAGALLSALDGQSAAALAELNIRVDERTTSSTLDRLLAQAGGNARLESALRHLKILNAKLKSYFCILDTTASWTNGYFSQQVLPEYIYPQGHVFEDLETRQVGTGVYRPETAPAVVAILDACLVPLSELENLDQGLNHFPQNEITIMMRGGDLLPGSDQVTRASLVIKYKPQLGVDRETLRVSEKMKNHLIKAATDGGF